MNQDTEAIGQTNLKTDSGHTWSYKEDFLKATRDLEASRNRVKELEAKLVEARETLTFYADKDNWERINIIQGPFHFDTRWASNLREKDCAFYNTGGGRARVTLNKIRGGV